MMGALWVDATSDDGTDYSARWQDVPNEVQDQILAFATDLIGRGPDTVT
jgi:hypothetical protein